MRAFLEKLIVTLHGLQILDQLVFQIIVELSIDSDVLADTESVEYQAIQIKQLVFSAAFIASLLFISVCSTLRLHLYPTAISGSLLVFDQVAQMSDRYYVSMPPDFTAWNTYAQALFLALNILCFVTTRYLLRSFDGDFQKLKFSGPYAVGHKVVHGGEKGGAISVFYPVDKDYESQVKSKKAAKAWCQVNDFNKFLEARSECERWDREMDKSDSARYYKFVKQIRTKAIDCAELSQVFANGQHQLQPLIFSHGLMFSRHHYQTMAHEFASHGFIVFLPDHLDGSCCYTELQSGEVKHFDDSHTRFQNQIGKDDQEAREIKHHWRSKVDKRVNEVNKLIETISDPKFAKDVLDFPANVKIDCDNIVVSGHQMGGATALIVADKNERVRSVLVNDPWLDLLHGARITKFKQIYTKQVQVINSLQYQMTEQTRKIYDRHFAPYFEDESRLQGVVFDNTDSLHMTDLSVILPFETDIFIDTRFKEKQQPDPQGGRLYQLFTYHQLKFLNDQGLLGDKQRANMDQVDGHVSEASTQTKKGKTGYIYQASDFLEEKLLKTTKVEEA